MNDTFTNSSSFLDSYKNNCNTFCGRWTVKGRIENSGKPQIRYTRLGCKRWNCPRCGIKRVKQVRHAVIMKATELKLTRFLTLTLDPSMCEADQSVEYIRNCWRKFRVALKRHAGVSITFISILEFQKNGYAHLHILVDRFLLHAWIQEAWQAVGGGKQVRIEFVDIHRIANYLSKYLTKEILLSNHYMKYRRFTTSLKMSLFQKPLKGQWTLVTASIEYLHKLARQTIEKHFGEDGLLDWFSVEIPISP